MLEPKELGGRATTHVPASQQVALQQYRTPSRHNLSLRRDLICICRLTLALFGAIIFAELTLPRQIQLGSLIVLYLGVLWWTNRRMRRYFRVEDGGRDE